MTVIKNEIETDLLVALGFERQENSRYVLEIGEFKIIYQWSTEHVWLVDKYAEMYLPFLTTMEQMKALIIAITPA